MNSSTTANTPATPWWQGIRDAFWQNKRYKFVSLLIAISLFVLVNTDRDRVISIKVPISFELPVGMGLVEAALPHVEVNIKGAWRQVKRFDERELGRIEVNLSDSATGEHTFRDNEIQLPRGLRVISIQPRTVRVRYEPLERASVTISPMVVGEPSDGLRLLETRVAPSQIEVTGGKSLIAALETIRTEDIPLQGRKESFITNVALKIPEFVSTQKNLAEVQIDIGVDLSSRTFEEVPVRVVDSNGDSVSFVVSQKTTVIVRGARALVEKLDVAPQLVVTVPKEQISAKSAFVLPPRIEAPTDGLAYEIVPKEVALKRKRR